MCDLSFSKEMGRVQQIGLMSRVENKYGQKRVGEKAPVVLTVSQAQLTSIPPPVLPRPILHPFPDVGLCSLFPRPTMVVSPPSPGKTISSSLSPTQVPCPLSLPTHYPLNPPSCETMEWQDFSTSAPNLLKARQNPTSTLTSSIRN